MEEDENKSTNGDNNDSAKQFSCLQDGKSSEDLFEQVKQLESEKRLMQNEFNTQRARLKELFIQTEQAKLALQQDYAKCQAERDALKRELDEMKSQFVVADLKSENEMHFKEMKAQEEISSLQQLVQDTIEESTVCKTELERIKEECRRYWQENCELREELQQQQQESSNSLGPQMLSQVKRTLARRLGADSSSSSHQESIDDSTKCKTSGKQYAHEDAEVLHSIVEQLQEEMNALKVKLREADEKLHGNNFSFNHLELADSSSNNPNETDEIQINKLMSVDTVKSSCASCIELENKIEKLLAQETKNNEEIINLKKCLAEAQEDLEKEAALRRDLEDQWQEKRESHKAEVQQLREQVKLNEKTLLDMQQKFLETKDEVMRQLQRVTDERERVNKYLETVQADNDFLSGRYLATAEEIESQYINLPNTVDELQELILRQQNDLIQARVGSEYEKQKCVTSLDEIQILRDQLEASNNEQRAYRKKVQTEIKSLQNRITEHLLTLQNYETMKIALERKEVELNRRISEFRVENIELQENNEKLNKVNAEYKSKIKNLQEDLATSEQVQKDFVKLSQTLQMSLEKLRHADSEVRWQDDEDVDNCPSCNIGFTVTVRKLHCRHCGHIYCDKCLSKTVPSGPRKRVARVCDICHTLLTPNTAPYFSHEPLQAT